MKTRYESNGFRKDQHKVLMSSTQWLENGCTGGTGKEVE